MATPPEQAVADEPDNQEISYTDAFAPAAANTNAPPEVPMSGTPSGQREMTYQEAFPPSAIALQSGKDYQSVKNIATAFGESIGQSSDDIEKELFDKNGGDVVSSMKSAGAFQPYVEDQKDFNKGFFYKTAYPAIYNMASYLGEGSARDLSIAASAAMAPINAVGTAIGQTIQETTGLDPDEQMGIAQTLESNIPGLGKVIGGGLEWTASLAKRFERVPRPVAEGEASGVVGTTEGQNSGVEPLSEDQHVRQTVAESEVNPIRAAEPVTETPAPENDVHTNARALDPETFSKYDQLAATRDDLRSKLSDNPPDADEIKRQLQETNAGMRELAPKTSNAYLQAQQFEKQPESVMADEMAGAPSIEPLEEQKAELADEPEKVSPIAADITKKLVDIGQPTEQAQASGEVAARMYQYFADIYGGEKGTAQDWYEREGADIKGAKERATTLAQPGKGGAELKQAADHEAFDDLLADAKHPVNGRSYHEELDEALSRPETNTIDTPARRALRKKIVDDMYGNGAKRKESIVHIVTGAPGAGKTSAVVSGLVKKLGAIDIDPDNVKDKLPEYDHGSGSFAVHKESQDIARNAPYSLLNKAVKSKDNLVLPVVGQNLAGLTELVEKLKKDGYTVHIDHVDVSEENSLKRVVERFKETGRSVPLDYVKQTNKEVNNVHEQIRSNPAVSGYARIDNNGTEPRITESHNSPEIEGVLEAGGRGTGSGSGDDRANNGETSDQELEQSTKGRIKLATDDASAVISLMKNADASTFVHESAHHFLDMMDRFSKEDGAPQKLKDDMAAIRKWSGLSEKSYETPKEKKSYVAAQEKFARGFERYFMEGVAPNRNMALVFAKFKNWLTSIYRTVFSIPNQRGSINEDVRAFFDRVMSGTPERTVIAPNHPAELGLKSNIESPRLGDLFGTVPKAPQSLTEWLAGKGGIKDDAGDLTASDADKAHIDLKTGKAKPFASKLVKESGLNLDDAARAAQEAGYFPEKGDERPSVEELKNKILEDLSGNKQYSDKDHEALNNHQDALKYNAQTEQIAHETGIDPTGKTHDQFFDEVNKYYQDEKRYNEAQEMAADTEKDYADYEKREREFIETRGDAWEPPAEAEHATLEDLENERKQEQAAHDAASSTANAERPERAAGIGQPGEAGVRESGDSAEPDGRAGPGQSETDAAELAARQQLDAARANIADAPVGDTAGPEPKPATRPNEPSGKSEFYDKAGNVRLDLLTDSDSIKAAMREAAEKNPQIFNHGVITDAQVAEFADAMGADAKNLNIQKLRAMSVEDDIPLAARIRSGSQMMVDALNHSLELMNKANPTDEDAAKFLEAKNQFMMIAETVSATTNEMGRGFRAYNNLMKEYNVTDISEVAELYQRMTGRTLDQVKAEMKAGSSLKTPKQVAKFTRDSLKPDFMDKLLEYRNNSLLSGPTTHTMYTVGGFLNAAYKPLQTLSGIGVQAVREALGGEITERMYAHEALAQFTALGYGSMRGLRAAAESWHRNAEVALPGEIKYAPLLEGVEDGLKDVKGVGWFPRNQAISGKLGTAINIPSRVIGSIHTFLKVLGYEQNKAGLVARDALEKGFDPKTDEYAKYVSDGISDPSPKIMDASGKETLKGVYRERVDYNSPSGKLFNLINSHSATKVLFPFIKMQYNIKRLAFRDNSVLGFFSPEIRADVSGINGDVAKNMAIGKIAAGTAIVGLGISMTMQGMNNGGGPSDPKAYKTWRLTHTPYAVQIGSIVIPHKALGTWGQLLGWSADMAEGAHEFDSANIEKSAWHFVRKSAAIFTEEGFMTQANNTLDAAFTPEQFGTRFIQNFATQWLPFSTGFSQTNRLLNDPYARRVKSLGAENLWGIPEAMEYKYPGASELLQPNRDMFGQPITFSSSYDKYANDRVVQKLESLQTGIGRLNDKIKGVQLTEQQYDDYSRIAGKMTYARLSKMVAMPGFDKMPPQHQIQMIEKTTTECRLLAANTVMKMNPQIMIDARAKKKLAIYGSPSVNNAEQNQTEDVSNP